jgi:hypothetical protein
MTTSYIQSAAGTNNPVLTLSVTGAAGNLQVPTLQDVTINNANDVFTWSQLNESAKLQVATTATNSIATNIVVENLSFFGNAAAATGSAVKLGLLGLSKAKTETNFTINLGTAVISGVGYVTGLAPSVSADSPVWVTPLTLTVSGEYTVTV